MAAHEARPWGPFSTGATAGRDVAIAWALGATGAIGTQARLRGVVAIFHAQVVTV